MSHQYNNLGKWIIVIYIWLITLMCVILVSCADYNRFPLVWLGTSGFEADTFKIIDLYINELNMLAGKKLIVTEGDGSTLTIHHQPEIKAAVIVGRAIIERGKCTILLTDIAIKEQYLKAVLWHELGHCLGLGHDVEENQIMSPFVIPWDEYTEDAINKFINNLTKSY